VDAKLRRSTWLVVAHASFEIAVFADAELAYAQVLSLTDEQDKSRKDLIENLAASIYKQGDQALKLADYKTAADHFLRIATVTPTSKIRATAEYDGAAALISLEDWKRAAEVLIGFRKSYPKHKLQSEVTKKLAVIYKADGRLVAAAKEFERIEKETKDEDLRREALLQAAELYEEAKDMDNALVVYQRYVKYFDKPLEFIVETQRKIAEIYLSKNDNKNYLKQLEKIVKADAGAGKERTDRIHYLAAKAALVLAEPTLKAFHEVRLVKPFEKNLKKKRARMKAALNAMSELVDYQIGEVTAAATYHIAEIYMDFSQALMKSDRPGNLNELEMEQYELALEEQAYPFEEKAISVFEKNVELLDMGIYNSWIDETIKMLSTLVPARYARTEIHSSYALSIN
jgi:tetratricopeptide (TPR) repeat protein